MAAALLVASLALPAYTCAGYVAPDGAVVTYIPPGADSAAYQPTRISHYALEESNPREWGLWLTILAFGWPLPILALRSRRPTSRWTHWAWWVEPICAVAAGWFILVSASWGRLAAGTYLALGATATLLVAWVIEAWRARVMRRAAAPLHPSTP